MKDFMDVEKRGREREILKNSGAERERERKGEIKGQNERER